MGWVTVRDTKTGKTEFYGDAPMGMKKEPEELKADDPLINLRAVANQRRLRRATENLDRDEY